MAHWLQTWRDQLFRLIDSDVVRPFQVAVYASILIAGIYMFFFGVPSEVGRVLGPVMHQVWVALAIIGPLIVYLGDRLTNSGTYKATRYRGGGRRVYWGWYLQAGGDLAIGMGVYLPYCIASFSRWGQQGIFGPFIISGLIVCSTVLVIRDIRRVQAIEGM